MTKTKAPAFQLYASDVLSSDAVATMSTEAIGAYFLLLCRDWKHVGLPNDHGKLAKWAKVTPRKFAKLWPAISCEFEEREDGRLYNPRLEDEREKQAEWRAKSAAGGRASGRSRRTKGGSRVVEPNTNTSVFSLQSSNTPSPPVPDGDGGGTRKGLRAKGTNPRTLGTNPRALVRRNPEPVEVVIERNWRDDVIEGVAPWPAPPEPVS